MYATYIPTYGCKYEPDIVKISNIKVNDKNRPIEYRLNPFAGTFFPNSRQVAVSLDQVSCVKIDDNPRSVTQLTNAAGFSFIMSQYTGSPVYRPTMFNNSC